MVNLNCDICKFVRYKTRKSDFIKKYLNSLFVKKNQKLAYEI